MLLEALLFLILLLVVLHPLIQRHRERTLARRLESVRDPVVAAQLVDGANAENACEGRTFRTLRDRVWPFLFR